MRILGAFAAISLCCSAAVWAKDIRPGDLRICGARHCRTVTDPRETRAFGNLLWGDGPVVRAPRPPVESRVFELRFADGPAVALIDATAIRVHGLNCGRFQRGKWYRLPARLRGVTRGLEPKRLRARVPRSC
jgi:hypothetical protein